MDVFTLSPSNASTASKGTKNAGPIEIPCDENHNPQTVVGDKSKGDTEAESRKLDELMEKFTRGFDPGSFSRDIVAWLPALSDQLFPGSYSHLLIILLESYGKMQKTQTDLEDWLRERYQRWTITHPSDSSITDEMFFGAEFEMLRRLLAPLRGDGKQIFWLNTRRGDCARACEHLEASVRIIEEFKRDILSILDPDTENRTIYSALPISMEHTAMISMKQLRLDGCRATLSWDGFDHSDIELTAFYQFYKNYITAHEPAKARASGWLPPITPSTPHSSANEAEEGDLANWSSQKYQQSVLNPLLRTALWLSVARGLAAVHLFCDVARFFTIHEPSKTANDVYVCFLQHLTQIRVSADGIPSHLTTPFPYRDGSPFDCNPDYFGDVWKSKHALTAGLAERLSLLEKIEKTSTTFKLSAPPCPRRAFHKEIRTLKQTPAVRGSLAGSWSRIISTQVKSDTIETTTNVMASELLDISSRRAAYFQGPEHTSTEYYVHPDQYIPNKEV